MSPQIPDKAMLWAILIGQILRESSFHAIENLVGSPQRRNLGVSRSFGDDALGYFTERWTRHPLAAPQFRRCGKPSATRHFRTVPSWDWLWMEPPLVDVANLNVPCA